MIIKVATKGLFFNGFFTAFESVSIKQNSFSFIKESFVNNVLSKSNGFMFYVFQVYD